MVEEENESLDGSEFSFSENIPTSKLRDSPHSVSSFVMPVMITNTTSLEEQVSTTSQTLEELMKSMKKREALRDTQITFLMDKMGNTSRLNREDESFKLKQTHTDKLESSTKDLKLSANRSISSDQLNDLIKEAIKDQVGGWKSIIYCLCQTIHSKDRSLEDAFKKFSPFVNKSPCYLFFTTYFLFWLFVGTSMICM